jgi:hypothetical protein
MAGPVSLEGDALLAILRASDAERAEIERVLATPDRTGLAVTPFGAITLAGSAAADDAPADASADDDVAAALAAYVPALDVERERTTLAQRAGMREHWVAGFVAADIVEDSTGMHRRGSRREIISPVPTMWATPLAAGTPSCTVTQPSSIRSSRAQTPPPE